MRNTLKQKTALVTGASSGLGADFARQLAGMGCGLILAARREERLLALKEELLAAYPVPVECMAIDLAASGSPEALHERIRASGRDVDVLVNNAGYGLYGDFVETPWERMQQMLELDIVALTRLTHLFVPDMRARGFGYVLNVASTGSFQPTPTYAAYSAAKAYVLSLGEALHYELRGSGVGCTTLCPGVTRTEFFDVAGQALTAYQRMTMMESSAVAHVGLQTMLRGRSSVVAGPFNALFAWGTRLLPRQTLAAISGRLMRA
jgi:uncharacterized protein